MHDLSEVVPFGKYRGRAVAEMLADTQYLRWLTMQPWFRERFSSLYVVVTQGVQPADTPTPEHNALQARFVDQRYAGLVVAALDGVTPVPVGGGFSSWAEALAAAELAAQAARSAIDGTKERLDAYDAAHDLRQRCEVQVRAHGEWSSPAQFEQFGWDVELAKYAIEIKPTVGDEYPCIVRTVRQRNTLEWCKRVVAFAQWTSVQQLSTVRAMFPDIIWFQLPDPLPSLVE